MATKRSMGRDRGRISSERHEISYAGSRVGGRGGVTKVRKAKKALRRKTGRKAVMRKARGR